jgi:hypothetical protein
MKPLAIANVVLVALIALAVWTFVQGWRGFDENMAGGAVGGAGDDGGVPTFVGSDNQGLVDTSVIVRANPFAVDRSSTVAALDGAPVPTALPRPYLSGTIRIGEDHMAMMAPSTATNRNEYRPLRVGQFVGGWEIVEIDEKSVVVASGGGRQTIAMNDRDVPRPSTNPGPQVSTVGAAAKAPAPAPSTTTPATGSTDAGTPRTVPYQTPFGTIQKVVP